MDVDSCSNKEVIFDFEAEDHRHPLPSRKSDEWTEKHGHVLVNPRHRLDHQLLESPQMSPEMAKLARMKIFTSVMLNAWRQRRADVRRLQHMVDSLQKHFIHSKNELHVSRTLMRVEQKRCVELQVELNKSALSIREVRGSCDTLNSALCILRTDKEKLEQELDQYRKQQEELNEVTSKCNEDLTNALMEHRHMRHQLSIEQTSVKRLKFDKQRLKNKMFEMETEYRKNRESFLYELDQKDEDLHRMRLAVECLEKKLRDRHPKGNESKHYLKNQDLADSMHGNQNALPVETRATVNKKAGNRGIAKILWTIHHFTSRAVFFLWLSYLPSKSLRYGCMLSKKIPFAKAK